jgi:hypothetical protein
MNHYYTDPLKAAWMAREHGFDLRTNDCRSPLPLWIFGRWIENKWDKKAVVAPESLPLLEPMVGDLVTNTHKGNRGRECSGIISQIMNGSASITTAERHNGKRYFVESITGLQIIQRNGKAFFMPESEGK